jgi:hypothetical protein
MVGSCFFRVSGIDPLDEMLLQGLRYCSSIEQ